MATRRSFSTAKSTITRNCEPSYANRDIDSAPICDTETVLHAFVEWDTSCFARLRGMFAVAILTKSDRRLVLARDRMGIKPLYIAREGEDLFFGSELKAILIHPEIERRLSMKGLDCYL